MIIASLEDDPAQAALIAQIITDAGHTCQQFARGNDLMTSMSKSNPYDIILIDWELPDISGLDVLRWIRSNYGLNIPVIFVTSRTSEQDLVTGLLAGADDYIVKPIRSGELLARINALSRRLNIINESNTEDNIVNYGIYRFDPIHKKAFVNKEPIDLAPKEFELALLFFSNPGRLFSRDVISMSIWNREIPSTSRTIDTHLSNMRRKLQIKSENGVRLHASYALGYRLEFLAT